MSKNWKKNNNQPKAGKWPHSGLISQVFQAFEEVFDQAFANASDEILVKLKELVKDHLAFQSKLEAATLSTRTLDNCIYLIIQKHLSTLTEIHLEVGIWGLKKMEQNYYADCFDLVNLCHKCQKTLTDSYKVIRNLSFKDTRSNQDSVNKHLNGLRSRFGEDYKKQWEKDKSAPKVSEYIGHLINMIRRDIIPFISPSSERELVEKMSELLNMAGSLKYLESKTKTWYARTNLALI